MTLTTLRLSKSNRNVAYRSKGTGEPLVLIHGVGMQSAAWMPQLDFLAQFCHVIALDLPGHGQSDPLPVGSQLPDYVSWCREVFDTFEMGPVNLAGHSMGALIAGGLAIEHPSLILRVAALNGVFRRDEAARSAVKARAGEIMSGKIDLQKPLDRWFNDHQNITRSQVATWLEAVDPEGYSTAYTAFAHGDAAYADHFSEIACPFLAITGEDDPNSTPAMTLAMSDQVQDGESVVIKGHRHMANLTASDEVNTYLLNWLKRPVRAKEMQ